MAEYRIVDDVLWPDKTKSLTYTGYHPTRVMGEMTKLLQEIFEITSPAVYEEEFKWDNSGDPIDFYARWRAKKNLDQRTVLWGIVKVMGTMSAKDKMGTVTVYIDGGLTTKFPADSVLQRLIYSIYAYLFYKDIRRRYTLDSRKYLLKLEDRVRQMFDIMARRNK